jgi:hypothetical protein
VTEITDISAFLWESYEQRAQETSPMSTIEEVRAAEKKVKEVLEALNHADSRDPKCVNSELNRATDDYYARAVRELKWRHRR